VLVDPASARRFADEWAAAWNSHDLERILDHYTDDVIFASPKIVQLMGDPAGEVRGKDALRAYWGKAFSTCLTCTSASRTSGSRWTPW